MNEQKDSQTNTRFRDPAQGVAKGAEASCCAVGDAVGVAVGDAVGDAVGSVQATPARVCVTLQYAQRSVICDFMRPIMRPIMRHMTWVCLPRARRVRPPHRTARHSMSTDRTFTDSKEIRLPHGAEQNVQWHVARSDDHRTFEKGMIEEERRSVCDARASGPVASEGVANNRSRSSFDGVRTSTGERSSGGNVPLRRHIPRK